MQYCFREIIEEEMGIEKGEKMIYEAGKRAGFSFFTHVLPKPDNFEEFITQIQNALKNFKIVIFRVEEADLNKGKMIVAVSEDLDCSGLPEIGWRMRV